MNSPADPPFLRVWAPNAVEVQIETPSGRHHMERVTPEGWWRATSRPAHHGDDYAFCIDGGPARPDPRSRWQPYGVHGASRVYDHTTFSWNDNGWHGVALPGSLLYELHVGTFTTEGTFDAAIERIDHLVELGVDAVQLLPLASFDGAHGWGYDGVALFAV